MDGGCVFCSVLAGKIPAEILKRSDNYVVLPDISPQAPIHLLFVSTRHGEELASVSLSKLANMLEGVRREIKERKLADLSYRIVINGARATMIHNHLHIHLLGSVDPDRPV